MSHSTTVCRQMLCVLTSHTISNCIVRLVSSYCCTLDSNETEAIACIAKTYPHTIRLGLTRNGNINVVVVAFAISILSLRCLWWWLWWWYCAITGSLYDFSVVFTFFFFSFRYMYLNFKIEKIECDIFFAKFLIYFLFSLLMNGFPRFFLNTKPRWNYVIFVSSNVCPLNWLE